MTTAIYKGRSLERGGEEDEVAYTGTRKDKETFG